MKYLSPNMFSGISTSSGNGSSSETSFYARVVRVITKTTDQGFNENGGLRAINGIFCSSIQSTTGESENKESSTIFAYQSNLNFLHVPIVGEVVKIDPVPAVDQSVLTLSKTYYYTTIVNLWNHPKDSLFYDVYKPIQIKSDHENFNINPIITVEGDTVMQGRYGQITKYTLDEISYEPRIYIASGRQYVDPAFTLVGENINTDYSPIELISNGITTLKSSNQFIKSHRKDQTPSSTDSYTGEQSVINSGRITLNSKEDSILVSSKKSVSTSASTINQEATKEICLESPKIFLGEKSMNSKLPEPIILGNKIEEYLSAILDELIELADSLASAVTISGQQLPLVNQKGAKTGVVLRSLKSKLNPKGLSDLKSKKSFVE